MWYRRRWSWAPNSTPCAWIRNPNKTYGPSIFWSDHFLEGQFSPHWEVFVYWSIFFFSFIPVFVTVTQLHPSCQFSLHDNLVLPFLSFCWKYTTHFNECIASAVLCISVIIKILAMAMHSISPVTCWLNNGEPVLGQVHKVTFSTSYSPDQKSIKCYLCCDIVVCFYIQVNDMDEMCGRQGWVILGTLQEHSNRDTDPFCL